MPTKPLAVALSFCGFKFARFEFERQDAVNVFFVNICGLSASKKDINRSKRSDKTALHPPVTGCRKIIQII